VWLIDEVTGLADWTQTLKFLRDNTLFGLDLVVCTGSTWPGRPT
jgi:predicted AAA+ superfamily ATPase